jgi:microcystin-dependent protein
MTLWKWSIDPATNGSADSTCPWPEGMAPSQVNDSARGNMAAIAKYRDDISGKLVTTGTSTAYAITSNQGFDTLAHLDGAMIAFVPHTVSGADPTLNVDGLGAKPLRGQSGTALLPGVLLEDTPYVAFYNNTAGEFVLHSYFVNPGEIPIGSGIEYWGNVVPSANFAFAYGQAISRTDNPVCFTRIGTTYGSGDGSTTFNLMDKRGRVSAAYDEMGGIAAGRLTTATMTTGGIGGTGGAQNQIIAKANLPNTTFAFTGTGAIITSTSTVSDVARAPGLETVQAGSNAIYGMLSGATFSSITSTAFYAPAGSVSSGGSGTALVTAQPTIICNYILRIK